ncbi:MAG: hypothetical protein ACTHLA_01670 [Asticcacaulis sp.]|uniref:hypothetical protein n=1 Tax=Asticcacaulis sp. TaxID=1872648 RepID=UPI003F7CD035
MKRRIFECNGIYAVAANVLAARDIPGMGEGVMSDVTDRLFRLANTVLGPEDRQRCLSFEIDGAEAFVMGAPIAINYVNKAIATYVAFPNYLAEWTVASKNQRQKIGGLEARGRAADELVSEYGAEIQRLNAALGKAHDDIHAKAERILILEAENMALKAPPPTPAEAQVSAAKAWQDQADDPFTGQEQAVEPRPARSGHATTDEILKRDYPAGRPWRDLLNEIRLNDDRTEKAIRRRAEILGLKRPATGAAVHTPAPTATQTAQSHPLPTLSRLALTHGDTVMRLSDEGNNPDEIAKEINFGLRRNDKINAAQVKAILTEMRAFDKAKKAVAA